MTADLRGDRGEALSAGKTWTKPPADRTIWKGPERVFLFFHVPGEQGAKLEVSPPLTAERLLRYRSGDLIPGLSGRAQVINHPLSLYWVRDRGQVAAAAQQ